MICIRIESIWDKKCNNGELGNNDFISCGYFEFVGDKENILVV